MVTLFRVAVFEVRRPPPRLSAALALRVELVRVGWRELASPPPNAGKLWERVERRICRVPEFLKPPPVLLVEPSLLSMVVSAMSANPRLNTPIPPPPVVP